MRLEPCEKPTLDGLEMRGVSKGGHGGPGGKGNTSESSAPEAMVTRVNSCWESSDWPLVGGSAEMEASGDHDHSRLGALAGPKAWVDRGQQRMGGGWQWAHSHSFEGL